MTSRKKILKKSYIKNHIPLVLTYSRFLPNITGIIRKYWSMLHINKDIYGLLEEGPGKAFKRNLNLKELIGSTRIEKGKVKKLNNTDVNGKCPPCLSKTGNFML